MDVKDRFEVMGSDPGNDFLTVRCKDCHVIMDLALDNWMFEAQKHVCETQSRETK